MKIFKILSVIIMAAAIFAGAGSCGVNKTSKKQMYNIDYGGAKFAFQDDNGKEPKDRYQAGEVVTLCFFMVATDTSYSFFLDDEQLNPVDFSWEKGFVLRFTMPEHDVKVSYSMRNTMIWEPDRRSE